MYNSDNFTPDPVASDDEGHSTVTFILKNLNYVKKKLFDPEISYLRKRFQHDLTKICKDNKDSFDKMLDQLQKRSKDDLNVVNSLANHY